MENIFKSLTNRLINLIDLNTTSQNNNSARVVVFISMKNFLTAFIVFMIWSLFGLWIYSWIQPEDISSNFEVEIPKRNIKTPSENKDAMIKEIIIDSSALIKEKSIVELKNDSIPIDNKIEILEFKAINAEGDIIFLYPNGIPITKNILDITFPENSKDFKYKINSFLLEHPNQEVHIHSIYSPQENVSTPNIGIQRALFIEEKLISIGVPKEKIVKKSIIKNSIFSEEDQYSNGFYFTFNKLDLERVKAIIDSKPKNKNVYPKFTNSGVSVNNDLKQLLIELKQYFKEHPNKKVDIVGHTDNIGNSVDNYAEGLKYAQQVRWYLISKGGINKSSLKASSKGESEPIDNNNSKQGRTNNRRIEVIFK